MESIKASGTVAYQGSSPNVTADATVQRGTEFNSVGNALERKTERQNKEPKEKKEDGQTAQNSQIKKAVNQMNRQMKDSEAIFGIHDKTNRVTIKIVDKETKEVLKEYPPEQTLDMIAKVWEIAGILVDEKR